MKVRKANRARSRLHIAAAHPPHLEYNSDNRHYSSGQLNSLCLHLGSNNIHWTFFIVKQAQTSPELSILDILH